MVRGQRRGLLTRALLDGLERAHDGLGRVTSASLRDSVLMRVPRLAEESEEFDVRLRNQRPEISKLPSPPIVFGTVSADALPPLCVHVIAGAGQIGLLTLYDGTAQKLGQIAASKATADEPWELELPRNSLVYMVEHSGTLEQIPILPQHVVREPHIVAF